MDPPALPRAYRDLVALTVLALLAERPRHPYEMQRLIRDRRKDFALGQPRRLYHAVDRLVRDGYVEPAETSRDGKRPERTVYRITAEGRDELGARLDELIRTPVRESPLFVAAISFLTVLPTEVARAALAKRAVLLEGEFVGIQTQLRGVGEHLPRIVLLEAEFAQTLRRAEIDWVRALIEEIRVGALSWDPESLLRWSADGEERSPPVGRTARPATPRDADGSEEDA